MQKYVVLEIITQENGRIAAPVNAYDTEEEAKAKFHDVMKGAYRSQHPIHSCVVLNSSGFSLVDECVQHEIVPPEPEPEAEPEPEDEPVDNGE